MTTKPDTHTLFQQNLHFFLTFALLTSYDQFLVRHVPINNFCIINCSKSLKVPATQKESENYIMNLPYTSEHCQVPFRNIFEVMKEK